MGVAATPAARRGGGGVVPAAHPAGGGMGEELLGMRFDLSVLLPERTSRR